MTNVDPLAAARKHLAVPIEADDPMAAAYKFLGFHPGNVTLSLDDVTLLRFEAEHPSPRPPAPRDGRSRYRLPTPGTSKDRSWTRATTFAKTIAETYGLQKWNERNIAVGMANRPDLILAVQQIIAASTTNPAMNPDGKTYKDSLDVVIDKACQAAGARHSASLGTALHTMTEHHDLGTGVVAPEPWNLEVAAYATALDVAGIIRPAEWVERIVVCPEVDTVGTLDRIVERRPDITWEGRPWTGPRIGDLKTGARLDYSWVEIAIQLAQYAHATHMWDFDLNDWVEMPEVDMDTALVFHLPVGARYCTIYEVDIARGWEIALTCQAVKQARRDAKILAAPVVTAAVNEATGIVAGSGSIEDLTIDTDPEQAVNRHLAAIAGHIGFAPWTALVEGDIAAIHAAMDATGCDDTEWEALAAAIIDCLPDAVWDAAADLVAEDTTSLATVTELRRPDAVIPPPEAPEPWIAPAEWAKALSPEPPIDTTATEPTVDFDTGEIIGGSVDITEAMCFDGHICCADPIVHKHGKRRPDCPKCEAAADLVAAAAVAGQPVGNVTADAVATIAGQPVDPAEPPMWEGSDYEAAAWQANLARIQEAFGDGAVDVTEPEPVTPPSPAQDTPGPDVPPQVAVARSAWLTARLAGIAGNWAAEQVVNAVWPNDMPGVGPWYDTQIDTVLPAVMTAEGIVGAPFPEPDPGATVAAPSWVAAAVAPATQAAPPRQAPTWPVKFTAGDGQPPDPDQVANIQQAMADLEEWRLNLLRRWGHDARTHGYPWEAGPAPTHRTATLTGAALAAVQHLVPGLTDELVRAALSTVLDTQFEPSWLTGAIIGSLSTDQAGVFATYASTAAVDPHVLIELGEVQPDAPGVDLSATEA